MNAALACQHGFNPYAAYPDTGGLFSSIKHAVSSVGKTVAKVASAPERAVVNAAAKAGIPGAKIVTMFAAPGLSATTQGGQAIQGTLNSISSGSLKQLASNAQMALKNAGPAGMVASGALGAMSAGLSGRNLESIAWAAAEGAAPAGIDTAIKAAESLRHGANVLTTALNAAQSAFAPGSQEAFGFQTAVDTLKKVASKAALGVARQALPSEGARRAFDAAVGVISKAANGAPQLSNILPRAGSIANIVLSRPKALLTAVPSATQNVVDAIKRNPAMIAGNNYAAIANQLRTNAATVRDAMVLAHSGKPLLPWKSFDPHVVAWIRKYVPNAPVTALRHSHTNVGGLDATGTTYIVEKGDSPWAIAQKLSGNGNNWPQLKDYNKDKNPTVDKNVWAGEVLNLPPSWQKPVKMIPKPTLPALPSVPAPSITPTPTVLTPPSTSDIIPGILQAKAVLAAWSKTDGVNQGGLSDYGLNAADLSTTMGPRDTSELAAFQVWDNRVANAGLNVAGTLDAPTLAALQSWATARATNAVNLPAPAVPSVPGLPSTIPTLPTPALPAVTPAPSVQGGGAGPAGAPQVATPLNPATGSSTAVKVAGGAIVGGVLFGIPGAIIGGLAGAAVS